MGMMKLCREHGVFGLWRRTPESFFAVLINLFPTISG